MGLSFDLSEGRLLRVTGPSGCGKSTLGDVILGLVKPSAGRVERVLDMPPTALQKLFQEPVTAFSRHRSLGRTLRLSEIAHIEGTAA